MQDIPGIPDADRLAPGSSGGETVAAPPEVMAAEAYAGPEAAGRSVRPPGVNGGSALLPRSTDRESGVRASKPGGDAAPGGLEWPDVVQLPAPLGDYRILQQVGRGGMGVVYEAVQLSLGRRVALKVLPFAAALDPKYLQRFKNEAHAAALLQHPHIVPVFAVGCERGVHYYAMQYIEGQSLAALIAELQAQGDPAAARLRAPDTSAAGSAARHATNGSSKGGDPATTAALGRRRAAADVDQTLPTAAAAHGSEARAADATASGMHNFSTERSTRRKTFFRRVAELGRDAAGALEHAHQLGIVHRDVKPANLLLDGQGKVWVTDFGLASMQRGGTLTTIGELVGTVRYMSPEQALARHAVVDHRTDVYSLGATLYELLTLRPAFEGEDREAVLRAIEEGEPRPPRRIDRAIPEDLETIVLKAMAYDPADRYGTAAAMAEDFGQWLADRPIKARRPSLRQRTTRWARRHRPLVFFAVGLLLAAVAALLVTTVVVARAYERERQRAEEVFAQRQRAEANLRQARRAVNLLTRVTEEKLPAIPGVQGARRQLLEAALDYYQGFIDQYQGDPSVQRELRASQARVTRLLAELSALHGPAQVRLLLNGAVRNELKLSPEQRDQVAALSGRLSEQWRASFAGLKKLSKEQRRERSSAEAAATEKEVAAILTPGQRRRFAEITLQVQQHGRHGFSDPEVVEPLKLSIGQRERIAQIQQDAFMAAGKGQAGAAASWEQRQEAGRFWQDVQLKLLDVLTPAQQAKWSEMAGAPVQGWLQFLYFDGYDIHDLRFIPAARGRPGGGQAPWGQSRR